MTTNSSDEVDDYYEKYYASVHSSGALGIANKIIHSNLERDRKRFFERVLELGCGNFEHFPFVSHGYSVYTATDIRMPPISRIENFLKQNKGNEFLIADCKNLLF